MEQKWAEKWSNSTQKWVIFSLKIAKLKKPDFPPSEVSGKVDKKSLNAMDSNWNGQPFACAYKIDAALFGYKAI